MLIPLISGNIRRFCLHFTTSERSVKTSLHEPAITQYPLQRRYHLLPREFSLLLHLLISDLTWDLRPYLVCHSTLSFRYSATDMSYISTSNSFSKSHYQRCSTGEWLWKSDHLCLARQLTNDLRGLDCVWSSAFLDHTCDCVSFLPRLSHSPSSLLFMYPRRYLLLGCPLLDHLHSTSPALFIVLRIWALTLWIDRFSASMVSTVVARSFLRLHSPQQFYDGVEMSSLDLTDSKTSKKSSETGQIFVDQTTFKSTDFMVSDQWKYYPVHYLLRSSSRCLHMCERFPRYSSLVQHVGFANNE